MSLVRADIPRAPVSEPARSAAVVALTAFGADLFSALPDSDNLVCSPYSVATALGMTLQGARGDTAAEMLRVLHAEDAARLADGLNAVDLALGYRSAPVPEPSRGMPVHLVLAGANSMWGQRGEPWQQPFLDALARDFGTGVREADFRQSASQARAAINGWVSERTRARIRELLPAGTPDADTRLVLVNALYLKAPWQQPFPRDLTREKPFHRLDGSSVAVEMMTGDGAGSGHARGPGWVAAGLPYAGGELAMTVVVPDAGRFAEVRRSLTGPRLTRLLARLRPGPVMVRLPRWRVRTRVDLRAVLGGLGMPTAFTDGADFSGMTTAERLYLSAAVHAGFIAVDEAGTEAAAATAVVARVTSIVVDPPTVVADRPFLYVIHDRPTGAVLFIGQVLDPTA